MLLLVLSFVFANLYAQHISFMGIQLGQSENVVDRMLKQKGFRFVGINNVMFTKMYDGTFWRFQNTRLNTEVENGKVTAITLCPSYEIYNRPSDFNNLVSNLDKKYGKHHNISNFFTSGRYVREKGYYWRVTGGYIVSYYAQNEYTREIIISIDYLDNTNKEIIYLLGRKRNTENDL